MKHRTRNGEIIDFKDIETDHLANIVRMIERKSREGLVVIEGGGYDAESFWAEECTLWGEEALQYLRYDAYLDELSKRKLTHKIRGI